MKENDFLEENEITEESVVDLDLIEEVMTEMEAAEAAPAEGSPDPFDAVASAVEEAAEEQFADASYAAEEVYPIDVEINPAGEEIYADDGDIPHDQFEAPEAGAELTAADTAMYSAGLYHPEDEAYDPDGADPTEPAFQDDAFRSGDSEEFQQMLESSGEEEAAPTTNKSDRPTRKGRPKRRKGPGLMGIPHLFAAIIWLLIILAIGVSLGRVIWVCAADVLAFGRESKEVTLTVTTDDTIEDIAAKLQEAGLVRYPELFLLYADLTDVEEEEKISSGTFTLNTIYDYHALVSAMSPSSGSRAVVEDVLIPEGFSCRQIFALLEEKGICKASELEEYAANGELSDYWFLEGVERGDKYCLEGFLFPDTYDFYENSSPRQALEKLLNGFEYRFTEELYEQLPALNERISEMMRENGEDEEYIDAHQLDLRGLITVASLIEEETANNAESFKIASVIYNRLFSWGDTPRYLNIDAAIFYALGEHKEALTAEDLQIDSPYNTYTNTGLVPGPITNPGLASLKAALNPEDTSYFYYVLDPDEGAHRFNKTYEEHEEDRIDIYGG